VIDFMRERVEARGGSAMAEAPQEAMKLLKTFQFERTRWNERVSMLSGGERRRLQLMAVLTKRPNFLILDEPTNDIDLDTMHSLEEYLQSYKGVVSNFNSFQPAVMSEQMPSHVILFFALFAEIILAGRSKP
jgi:ATP-binding cassette subfamily F protein uup